MGDDVTVQAPDQIATAAEFTRELQALRARSGLTIRAIARAAKTPVATTGDYFSGRHLPLDRDQFARILTACGDSDPARIEQWQAALVRARRLPGRRTGTPYRGLARFEAEDARWFFGREDVTELLAYLAGAPSSLPLLLIGPSGAGKSSLLRAGLLPRLRSAAAEADLDLAVGESGNSGNDDLGSDDLEKDGPIVVGDLTVTGVPRLTARIAKLAAEAAGGAPWAGRAAVIVDQFEAVFTLCDDEGERRALIEGLCDLAQTELVVLALRADFYQQAIRYPGLIRAAQERHVVLGPMSVEQVRRAVVEPARLAKTEVAPGLVEVLLADLAPDADVNGAHEPGALPMLSHALLTAWEHSRGGTLTVADYLAGGGIKEALTRSAEQAYESLSPSQQLLARRLFLRLVHVADELPPSRAAVPLGELLSGIGEGADAERVLAVFIDERMITVDVGAARLTHDALLTAWPRLRAWIEEGAEELRTRRRISSSARAWAEAGREEAALWRGSQLAVAREWAEDPDKRAALPPLAGEFVGAAVAAGAARERLERRRTNRLRSIVAVLTVLVVAVCLLAGYAFKQRQQATAARDVAITAQQDANSREVANEAEQLRALDPALAAQLSVAAYGIARTQQATAALLESTGDGRRRANRGLVRHRAGGRRLAGPAAARRRWRGRHAAAVERDRPRSRHAGRAAAAAGQQRPPALHGRVQPGRQGAGRGGRRAGGQALGRVESGPPGAARRAADRPEEHDLLGRVQPGRAHPRRRQRRRHGAAVGRDRPGPRSAARPAAHRADRVRSDPSRSPPTAGSWPRAAGTPWRAATTTPSGCGTCADPARPRLLRGMPLTGPASVVSGVAFSPAGGAARRVQPGRQDLAVEDLRRPAGRSPDGTLTNSTNWVNTVAFSPSGGYLAAGTSEARVLVWNTATRALTATLPQPQPVTTVAWDGAGRLAAADADGTVSLWTLPSPVLLARQRVRFGRVHSRWHHDGRRRDQRRALGRPPAGR